MCGADRLGGSCEGSLKPEAVIEIGDVVVYGLRDANNGKVVAARSSGVSNFLGAAQTAVAAHDEEYGDIEPHQCGDHLVRVLVAAGGSENGAATIVNVVNDLGRKCHRRVDTDEAAVAIAEADDVDDAVVLRELEHKTADHIVEPGAQPTARDNGRTRCSGFEVQPRAGPTGLK